MTETITKPAVCEATKPQSHYPWRCQLKAGHDPVDKHMWPIESEHYNVPLDTHDAAWLASEIRLLLTQIEHLKRDHRQSTERTDRVLSELLAGLVTLAPANSTRKNVRTEAVQELWLKAVHG